LRGHGCLVGLVLGGLDLGLQVGRWVEVLALLAGAAALDVVHADGDGVVAGVDHGAVAGVSEAAVGLPASAVAPLELAAHLGAGESGGRTHRHTQTDTDVWGGGRQTQMWGRRAFRTCQERRFNKASN